MLEANAEFPILLSPRETARRIRSTAGTLAVWRSKRSKSLPFVYLKLIEYYLGKPSQIIEATGPDAGALKIVIEHIGGAKD